MITVTIIKNWGAFQPGDVIKVDPVRGRQLINQELALEGHQAVNDVDVNESVAELEANESQSGS